VTHTPGPWRVGDGGSWGAMVKDGNGDGICIPCSGRLGPTDAANARLIAAAPELLEALRALVANYGPPADYSAEFAILWADAEDVIAKVDGRQGE
jgi:hypothetical protein